MTFITKKKFKNHIRTVHICTIELLKRKLFFLTCLLFVGKIYSIFMYINIIERIRYIGVIEQKVATLVLVTRI